MMMTKYLLVFIRAARSRPTGEVPCLALAASRCQSSLRLVCLVPNDCCAKISAEGGFVSLVEHIGIAHMVFFVVNGVDLL